MEKKLTILLSSFLLFTKAFSQTATSIVPANGIFLICVPANGKVKLQAEIKIPAGHVPIDKFIIEWDKFETREYSTLPANNIVESKELDFEDFYKNCSDDFKFLVSLTAEIKGSNPENNAYVITFKNTPRPNFDLKTACSGKEIQLNNKSCPGTNDIKYLWDYGDGSPPDANAKHTFATKGTYPITLTATNSCAPNGVKTTKNLTVIDPAVAIIADSGAVAIRPNSVTNVDTLLYCYGNGGGIFRIDGVTKSLGNPDDFEWRISGGQYNYLEKTGSNSPRPKIELLDKNAVYTIELRVDNACNQPSGWSKCFHILKDVPALELKPQDDKCEKFVYKPSPYFKDAEYKINGQLLPQNGEISVDLSATQYIVEAKLNNLCGNQVKLDTFRVAAPLPVVITAPVQNLNICSGTADVLLETNINGGNWEPSPYIKFDNGKYLFTPKDSGSFVITYKKGVGVCEKKDSKTILVKGVSLKLDDKTVCEGTQFVKLTSNLTGGVWETTSCSNCIKNDTLFIPPNPSNVLNVNYKLTGTNGCATAGNATIKINNPKADFDLAGGCIGKTGTITNKSIGANAYEWYLAGSMISENNIANNLAAGNNTVKLIAKNGSCSNEITKTVSISAAPKPIDFSLDKTVNCAPFSPIVTLQGTNEPSVTYTWDIGDGNPQSQFNPPNFNFQNFGFSPKTYTIKFSATNSCGTEYATPQVITVNPLAKAEIGIDSTVFRCSPALVTFTNRSQGATSATWYFGDNTPIVLNDKVIVKSFSATNIELNLPIILSVSNTCGTHSDTINIQIYPKTIKPFFEISKSIEICPGEKIQFKDSSTPKTKQWIWKENGVVFGNDSIISHSFSKENTTYKITLISQNGCNSDSVIREIKTKSKPKSSFQNLISTTCENEEIIFQNTANPSYRFLWQFGDNQVDSTTFSPKHIYTKAGNYVAKQIVYDGQKSCRDSSQVSLSILPRPKPNFELINNSIAMCSPATVRFKNLSINANDWYWEVNNGQSSKAKEPEFSLKSGQYSVKLVTSNGFCKDSITNLATFKIDSCKVFLPQAFTPNNDGIGDKFNIYGSESTIKIISFLRVFNRWGEIVFNGINIKPNSATEGWDGTINGKEAPIGLYTYQTQVEFADGSKNQSQGSIKLLR